MNRTLSLAEDDDLDLLARCLRGEREAFNGLVTRYQGLVCAQAYSICGDFSRSEDVAQEAFVAAWRQLPTLRDHGRFRAWLCGIARHLALAVAARRRREQPPEPAATEQTSPETPHDTLVTREEEAIVWHTLEKLPEAYREVLVLFYREHQSVFQVAALLGASEDAIKQRLSRGRAMLRQEVASAVEVTLARTRPGPGFCIGVLGALGMPAATGTASATATLVKGGAAAKLGAISLAGLGAVLGGIFGCFGGWLGVKVSAESAPYERLRDSILYRGRRIGIAIAGFVVLEMAAIWGVDTLWHDPRAVVAAMACLVTAFGLWMWREIRQTNAATRRILQEEAAAGSPRFVPGKFARWFGFVHRFEARSRHTLLGWPLWHLQWGHDDGKTKRPAPHAWIAVGDRPVGFIAMGAVARGVFAFGAVALGLFSVGGASLGIFAIGGCVIAACGYGGIVLGWVTNGGFTVAWKLAVGGIAVAKEHALGDFVLAAHANDAAARAVAAASWWEHLSAQWWFPFIAPGLTILFFLLPGPIMAAIAKRRE
jgi:RNA polymerase sigma factor (sigma-70 family)